MSNPQERQDLEKTLRQYLEDPRGRQWLQSLDETGIRAVAGKLIRENPYGDIGLLSKTIEGVWGKDLLSEFIEHAVWCAHREAIHRSNVNGIAQPQINFTARGIEHLHETSGQPTIIISPMTLCTDDAVDGIVTVLKQHQPGRKIIFYGEHMESYLQRRPEYSSLFASDNVVGIKKILSVLHDGGLFLTYPDFVYNAHGAIETELFGRPRSVSSGLLKIAARTNAIFLPAAIKHITGSIEFCFFDGVPQPESPAAYAGFREQVLAIVISKLLEGLIDQVQGQWRLLPTLSQEAAEMARV